VNIVRNRKSVTIGAGTVNAGFEVVLSDLNLLFG
jgi:hypothetical protein